MSIMKAVSQGKNRKTECEEPLLLWAVRDSETRPLVHVGMLTAAENGSACRCLCLSCGENLRAINADKPASHFDKPRTQRRHFKHHHSSAGESRCLSSVARLVALQLFVEQDAIYLPPRRRTVSRLSPTGVPIEIQKETPGRLVQVKSRTWVDDRSAILRLEDGREFLVTVRAHHQVGDDRRSSCVLSLAGVHDPAIAGWDSDKILQHLRLPGCGMDWENHWDDAELDAQKEIDLAKREDLYLGGIPREWLANLDGRQVNETVLHWLIKKTVVQKRILRVPEFSVPVRQRMLDGSIAEEIAFCRPDVLLLDDIRLERRFDSMVPDVMCRARRQGFNGPAFDFLIEAAVTNYISDEKRKKIIVSGVACIQIRADFFSRAGMVPVSAIEKVIWADASVKEWIVHPWIAAEIAKVQKRLEDQAIHIRHEMEAKAAAERRRQEAERQRLVDRVRLESWLTGATDQVLAKGYLKVLKASWLGHPVLQLGAEPVDINDLWSELKRREIVGKNRHVIEFKDGLLYSLIRIKEGSIGTGGSDFVSLFVQAIECRWKTAGNAFVIMLVLEKYYYLSMTPPQVETFNKCRASLHASIQDCDSRVCRITEHDRLYALLFPEIAQDLENDYGTQTYMSKLRRERETQKEREEQRRERRQARLEQASQLRYKKEQKELAQAIAQEMATVSGMLRWVGSGSHGKSAALLYGLHGAQVRLDDINAIDVFKIAIDFRDMGGSVDDALKAMVFKNVPDVRASIELLQLAKLCCSTR